MPGGPAADRYPIESMANLSGKSPFFPRDRPGNPRTLLAEKVVGQIAKELLD